MTMGRAATVESGLIGVAPVLPEGTASAVPFRVSVSTNFSPCGWISWFAARPHRLKPETNMRFAARLKPCPPSHYPDCASGVRRFLLHPVQVQRHA